MQSKNVTKLTWYSNRTTYTIPMSHHQFIIRLSRNLKKTHIWQKAVQPYVIQINIY